ncbi:MAG TPA: alpha/beta family hydrolase [Chitinophagaceae bacterium]|jgi:hypothetical protein
MMKTKKLTIKVNADIGSVSAECVMPGGPLAMLVLAHGAGAGMNHSFMTSMAKLLADRDIATLRYNFPFMEAGKGRPDSPAVAHATIAAAITRGISLAGSVPLFAGGKSFGGRMSSQYIAEHPLTAIGGLVFFGFPLHPAGKPSVDRADHLKKIQFPMLFLQGTRDALAEWKLIQKVCRPLKSATLARIENADHSFKAGKTDVHAILADTCREWIEKQIKR